MFRVWALGLWLSEVEERFGAYGHNDYMAEPTYLMSTWTVLG